MVMRLRVFPLAAGTTTYLFCCLGLSGPAGAVVPRTPAWALARVTPIAARAQISVGAATVPGPTPVPTPVPVGVAGAGGPVPTAAPVPIDTTPATGTIVSVSPTVAGSGSSTGSAGSANRGLSVTGAGWGHGRGLGQWGAYGYAIDLGWGYQQILNHFYSNTTTGTVAGQGIIKVRLTDLDTKAVTLYGDRRPVVVGPNGVVAPGAVAPPPPTAPAPISTEAPSPTPVPTPIGGSGDGSGGVPVRGATVTASEIELSSAAVGDPTLDSAPAAAADGPGAVQIKLIAPGTWQVLDSSSCAGPFTVRATVSAQSIVVRAPRISGPESPSSYAQVCERTGRRAYRGDYEIIDAGRDGQRTLNVVELDEYVRGVVPREIPSIWGNQPNGMAALKAQTVAARSYAAAERRNTAYQTCDTIACQVYRGMGVVNSKGVWEPSERPLTDQAVRETSGEVRFTATGKPARTEFSASTGGYTAPGDFPPVPDMGDGTTLNPNRRWTVRLTAAQLEAGRDLGAFQSAEVIKRDGSGSWGGRAVQLRLSFAKGSVTMGGQEFASKFRLRSSLFTFDPSAAGAGGVSAPGASPSVDPSSGAGGVAAIGSPEDGRDPVDVLLGVAARPPAPVVLTTTTTTTTTTTPTTVSAPKTTKKR